MDEMYHAFSEVKEFQGRKRVTVLWFCRARRCGSVDYANVIQNYESLAEPERVKLRRSFDQMFSSSELERLRVHVRDKYDAELEVHSAYEWQSEWPDDDDDDSDYLAPLEYEPDQCDPLFDDHDGPSGIEVCGLTQDWAGSHLPDDELESFLAELDEEEQEDSPIRQKMDLNDVERAFSKHDARLTVMNMALADAFMGLGLEPEQSTRSNGEPGDTLRFYLPRGERVLVSNQYYSKRGFMVVNWFRGQTKRLGVARDLKKVLATTIGFGDEDETPRPFTDSAMVIRLYPDDSEKVERLIPELVKILAPKLQ